METSGIDEKREMQIDKRDMQIMHIWGYEFSGL